MPLCPARFPVTVEAMTIDALTMFCGYRDYGFPIGSPGPAARV
ncbi:hypothetical protein [Longimicrobium sp.]